MSGSLTDSSKRAQGRGLEAARLNFSRITNPALMERSAMAWMPGAPPARDQRRRRRAFQVAAGVGIADSAVGCRDGLANARGHPSLESRAAAPPRSRFWTDADAGPSNARAP